MNTIRSLRKNTAAYKNSMFGRRIPCALISKKCLKSPEDLSIIYDPMVAIAGFTLKFSVLHLLNCLISADPLKTISIETPQAA